MDSEYDFDSPGKKSHMYMQEAHCHFTHLENHNLEALCKLKKIFLLFMALMLIFSQFDHEHESAIIEMSCKLDRITAKCV